MSWSHVLLLHGSNCGKRELQHRIIFLFTWGYDWLSLQIFTLNQISLFKSTECWSDKLQQRQILIISEQNPFPLEKERGNREGGSYEEPLLCVWCSRHLKSQVADQRMGDASLPSQPLSIYMWCSDFSCHSSFSQTFLNVPMLYRISTLVICVQLELDSWRGWLKSLCTLCPLILSPCKVKQ